MIPYDDLVAALSAWRARKGLPVSTIGAPPSAVIATPPPPPPPTFAAPSRPTPPRAAPAARAKPITVPPPLELPESPESLDVDDAAMLEEESAYENEGADFAVGFSAAEHEPDIDGGESTAIGGAPERPSDGGPTDPGAPIRTNNRNDDW